MSVVPFRRKVAVPLPAELYYQRDPCPAEALDLRALSEIEQMYAYWGSDVGNAPR